MKRILSEKNIVVILFVMVLITFSLAQEDTKKIEKMYFGGTIATAVADEAPVKKSQKVNNKVAPAVVTPAAITE
jgi:hypothetical protein